ncbi:MAG: ribosome recycling factor [Candidatus Omnitrophica bacterium]|nr:ribosome recycling factor [Candidatus Omnitrophota bacterium]
MPESKPAVTNIQSVLRDSEAKMQKAIEAVTKEFASIRTGRAAPSLVEGIRVEYYGAPTPLKQLAAINTPDPKLLTIQPWDLNALPEIEKALMKSDLGLSPYNDGKVIKISVPPLSTERRQELTKLAHKQAEEGRISIRNIRHASKESIEKLFKDKAITEDDKFKATDMLQKLTDRYQAKVDQILADKEKDLQIV